MASQLPASVFGAWASFIGCPSWRCWRRWGLQGRSITSASSFEATLGGVRKPPVTRLTGVQHFNTWEWPGFLRTTEANLDFGGPPAVIKFSEGRFMNSPTLCLLWILFHLLLSSARCLPRASARIKTSTLRTESQVLSKWSNAQSRSTARLLVSFLLLLLLRFLLLLLPMGMGRLKHE